MVPVGIVQPTEKENTDAMADQRPLGLLRKAQVGAIWILSGKASGFLLKR